MFLYTYIFKFHNIQYHIIQLYSCYKSNTLLLFICMGMWHLCYVGNPVSLQRTWWEMPSPHHAQADPHCHFQITCCLLPHLGLWSKFITDFRHSQNWETMICMMTIRMTLTLWWVQAVRRKGRAMMKI